MFTENGFMFLKAKAVLTEEGIQAELTPAGKILMAHIYSEMERTQAPVHCTAENLENEYAYCLRGFQRSMKALHSGGVIDYGQLGSRNSGNTFFKISKLTVIGNNQRTVIGLDGFKFDVDGIKTKTTMCEIVSPYYVYMCKVDSIPVYIGKGKGARYDHCTSGASHCRELNEAVIQGRNISVEILFENIAEDEAYLRETTIIQGLTAAGVVLYNKKRNG